jgi:hypothetical protein
MMHRIFALLIICVSLPSAAAAEQPLPGPTDDPLALTSVTAAELVAALSARQSCQTLVRLINHLGTRWQDVSSGALPRREFGELHQDARIEWDIRWGACTGARRDLNEGMPRSVLDAEAEQLKDIWKALDEVCTALEDDVGSARINQSASSYSAALERWTLELPKRARFWSGSAEEERDGSDNCIRQTERAQQDLAVRLMQASSSNAALRTNESIEALRLQLEETDRVRRECTHESPLERVELQLLGRLMRSYRRLFEGFVDGDDAAIRESMLTAQDTVSRLQRCRNEHSLGSLISPSCTPR